MRRKEEEEIMELRPQVWGPVYLVKFDNMIFTYYIYLLLSSAYGKLILAFHLCYSKNLILKQMYVKN